MGGMFRNELTNVFFWGALEYILEISMNQAVEWDFLFGFPSLEDICNINMYIDVGGPATQMKFPTKKNDQQIKLKKATLLF